MERPEFYAKNSSWCIHLKGAKKVTRTQEDNFAVVPNTIKTSNVIKSRVRDFGQQRKMKKTKDMCEVILRQK